MHDPFMQGYCAQQHSAGAQYHPVLTGLRDSLQSLKKPRSSKDLFLKRATVLMVMNSSTANISASAKALGTHRRNFYAARLKLQLEKQETLPLQLCERQARTKDAITDEIKELVLDFWTSNTRVSPNKKDVCRKHVGRKVHMIHPVHLLEQPQVGVFVTFILLIVYVGGTNAICPAKWHSSMYKILGHVMAACH